MTSRSFLLVLAVWWVDITTSWCRAHTGALYMENGVNYTVQQVNAGRKLNNLGSYRDVVLTEYKIPVETVSMIFGFASVSNPKGCNANKNVSVFIQHGGFPVFTINEARWPDHFFVNRSDTMGLIFPATDATWKLKKPVPRSGSYFSAVYVADNTSGIKQKGLSAKCDLSYVSTFLTAIYKDPVWIVSSGEKHVVKAIPGMPSHQLFKMCLMDQRYDAVDVFINCIEGCPLTVRARSDGLPVMAEYNESVTSAVCQTGPCTTLTYTPLQKTCQYVYVDYGEGFSANVSYTITITAVRCQTPGTGVMNEASMIMQKPAHAQLDAVRRWSNTSNTTLPDETALVRQSGRRNGGNEVSPLEQPSCPKVIAMARLDLGATFSTTFVSEESKDLNWPSAEHLTLSNAGFTDTIYRFDIAPYRDTGGTLHVALNVTEAAAADLQNFTVVACLNTGQGSRFTIESTCQGPVLKVNETNQYEEVLVPYPEIGTWHLVVQGRPLGLSSRAAANIRVGVTVELSQCVKGSCGQYGTCRVVLNSGVLITSACACSAGWKGWDCQDGSTADSMTELLLAVVFLTISNLVFIPAGIVAIRRQYYTEAVVYFSTCFFSSFYHACDQPLKQMTLCIMDYGVLQYCDFYVSILSFWVTIVAMADLPVFMRSIAHMAGCIGIALGVEYDRTGIWVFAVPAIVALVILGSSWGFRSYRMNKLSPQKHYWLIHFLPGLVLAALGLILFAFVETSSNYKFVHSVWHMLMAAAVICFLPPPNHRLDGKYPKLRAVGTDSNLSIANSHISQDPLVPARSSDSPLSGIVVG